MSKGNNLTKLFYDYLSSVGIQATRELDERGYITCLKFYNDLSFYTSYANITNECFWFGFSENNIIHKEFNYALLIIGDETPDYIFVIPFNKFRSFIKKGKLINTNNNYQQYEAHIFTKKEYLFMKVEGYPDEEFRLDEYLKSLKEFPSYLDTLQNK